ncbi:transcription initiation factor IID TAF10 subunit, partial [Pilobolus umbonatus]
NTKSSASIANMNPDSTNDIRSEPSTTDNNNVEVDKEREMAELLMTMDNYTPIIPDAVIEHYLNKTGFDCDDARIKKLFALAAQKFIADIATDAFQYNKTRQSGNRAASKPGKDKKVVLTMEDLSNALTEYGIHIKKPDYY